jgi:hypothetical protein
MVTVAEGSISGVTDDNHESLIECVDVGGIACRAFHVAMDEGQALMVKL